MGPGMLGRKALKGRKIKDSKKKEARNRKEVKCRRRKKDFLTGKQSKIAKQPKGTGGSAWIGVM